MKVLVLGLVTASLVFGSTALAADNSSTVLNGYGSNGARTVVAAKPKPPAGGTVKAASAAVQPKGSTLPFTGADMTYILAAGLGLLGLGVVIRRTARQKD